MAAARKGKCTRFGDCTNADLKKTIEVPAGADFVCPECKTPLADVSEPGSRVPKAAIVAGVLVLGALASWFLWPGKGPNPSNKEPVGVNTVVPPPLSSVVPSPSPPVVARILRLHGSNTIGDKLAPELVKAFIASRGGNYVGTINLGEDEVLLKFIESGRNEAVEIFSKGSATAFPDLASGACDIGMASRRIKPDESQRLMDAGLGDMTSPASENVLGLDGIAMIVNRDNPVETLSKAQIRSIFTGEITDWSGVRGTPGHIQIYARDDKSGTFDTFKTLVLAGQPLLPLAPAFRFENSEVLDDKVASDAAGIGFVGLPYAKHSKKISVSDASAAPLMPSPFTVATEDYPLSRRLFLYIAPTRTSSLVRDFVDFSLSDEGQKVVEQVGFIAQIIKYAPVRVPLNPPPEYLQLVRNAQRVNLDFRFRTGSDTLDNKALRDVDRVVNFLAKPENRDLAIILLGFADNQGGDRINCPLSRKRAHAVAEQLGINGVHAEGIAGFCSSLPVADNSTDDGRQKNRRVEIWVRTKA
jgi:phosphate transport system substrate-binding protein